MKADRMASGHDMEQRENYRRLAGERARERVRCMAPGCGVSGVPVFQRPDGRVLCGLCLDGVDMDRGARASWQRTRGGDV